MTAEPGDMPPAVARWRARVGEEIALSGWLVVDQAMIDGFAATTGDRHPLHVDPASTPARAFGGTIAHAFLSLALFTRLRGAAPGSFAEGSTGGLIYGGDRVRFMAPVRAGDRVRGRFTLRAVEPKGANWLETVEYRLEIAGSDRPALVADWLALLFF